MKPHRFGYISFNLGCVDADARITGIANCRIGGMDLLHHRPDEAGKFREFAFQNRLAEIDVAENPVKRVLVLVVRRRLEQGAGPLRTNSPPPR